MKILRNFDEIGARERRLVAIGSVPSGIAIVMLMNWEGGIGLATSIFNICITILAAMGFALIVRLLRRRGIELWQPDAKKVKVSA